VRLRGDDGRPWGRLFGAGVRRLPVCGRGAHGPSHQEEKRRRRATGGFLVFVIIIGVQGSPSPAMAWRLRSILKKNKEEVLCGFTVMMGGHGVQGFMVLGPACNLNLVLKR
jgi:hypothetical protein